MLIIVKSYVLTSGIMDHFSFILNINEDGVNKLNVYFESVYNTQFEPKVFLLIISILMF